MKIKFAVIILSLIYLNLNMLPSQPFFSGFINENVSNIQSLINSAHSGSIIFLEPGIYRENLVINKTIKLVGAGTFDAVLMGSGENDIIIVTADSVVIDSLTICDSGANYSGIYLRSVKNVSIINSAIKNCGLGIKIDSSVNITIENCTISECRRIGVRAWGSSANLSIYNSTFVNNDYAVGLFTYTEDSYIFSNIFFNNSMGLVLLNSKENKIEGNIISNNTYALYLEDRLSIENVVSKNEISYNKFGVYFNVFREFADNIFYMNNFIDNVCHVHFEPPFYSRNCWNLSYPLGGNYWSSHLSEDSRQGVNQDTPGSDGFLDKAYYIAENNIDYYPRAFSYVEFAESNEDQKGLDYTLIIFLIFSFTIIYMLFHVWFSRRYSLKRDRESDKRKSVVDNLESFNLLCVLIGSIIIRNGLSSSFVKIYFV